MIHNSIQNSNVTGIQTYPIIFTFNYTQSNSYNFTENNLISIFNRFIMREKTSILIMPKRFVSIKLTLNEKTCKSQKAF